MLYHIVLRAKYRRAVFDDRIEFIIKTICLEIQERYLKSLTAREILKRCPFVKKTLWGGELWIDGYFASTVGKHGDENMIGKYVKSPSGKYQKRHTDQLLTLF